jgi:hypothetical protein
VLAGSTARSCDLRTSKQTTATGQAIWGAKVWSGQCFRGVRSETWREIAHGQPRSWGLASGVQLAGGAMPAGNAGRIRGADRVRRRGAELARSAELLSGRFTEMAAGRRDTGAVWRGRRFEGKLGRPAGGALSGGGGAAELLKNCCKGWFG